MQQIKLVAQDLVQDANSLEQYTKRIEDLEKIASSFNGVNKVYALSAGREVRVIVEPEKITDAEAEFT